MTEVQALEQIALTGGRDDAIWHLKTELPRAQRGYDSL